MSQSNTLATTQWGPPPIYYDVTVQYISHYTMGIHPIYYDVTVQHVSHYTMGTSPPTYYDVTVQHVSHYTMGTSPPLTMMSLSNTLGIMPQGSPCNLLLSHIYRTGYFNWFKQFNTFLKNNSKFTQPIFSISPKVLLFYTRICKDYTNIIYKNNIFWWKNSRILTSASCFVYHSCHFSAPILKLQMLW